MTQDLAGFAAERGIKYFMISYTDLFGAQRAKLVPSQAIADMQTDGAGFAGFATWLDLTPAHPDLFAIPDASSVIQLPWKKDVAWVAADCMMDGNPTLLQEMVRNLVDNAINYSGRGGVVTARVLLDRFSGVMILQVEDNGPGIPAAERELVFQPFYRALGNEADGSGLGLPIVQEIARQHHAEIAVEDSRPGYSPPGTTFTLRFSPSAVNPPSEGA